MSKCTKCGANAVTAPEDHPTGEFLCRSCLIAALQAENKALKEAQRWIPCVERMPESGHAVLAFFKNHYGKGRRVRAMWVKKFTMDDNYEGDDGDYSEERDRYYWPEGWYEFNDSDETNWRLSDIVTHWMPLPPAPAQEKEGK